MGIDADKASHSNNLSRREFLKMMGVAGAGALIPAPDRQKQEPLPPREKLTEADLFNMALPILTRLQVLSDKGNAGLGTKIDVVREPGFMDGDSLSKWERDFPRFQLDNFRKDLESLDSLWNIPKKLAFFAYPLLNYSYLIPFSSYQVELDQQTGRMVPAGPIQEIYKRNQGYLPRNAVEIWGGRGFIGEMWRFETREHNYFGKLGIVWLAKRNIPSVDSQFSLNTSTDLMASISRKNLPEFFYKDDAGKQFAVNGSEDVLFIPIELNVMPNNAPDRSLEFNA